MHAPPAAAVPGAYVVQGRTVTMPVVVRDATAAAATFLVDARAARRLLPGPELDVAELLPGRAVLTIGGIDYRDNDLGDYDEVSLALFVRRRGEPAGVPWLGTAWALARNRLATWIWKLPVDQEFTRAAGSEIWGFPKTREEIALAPDAGRWRCRLAMDGRHVLTLTVPRGGRRTLPDAAMTTYTYLGGRLHATAFITGATEFAARPGGAQLALGDHPLADDLRALGLPRRALGTAWMGRMHARFEAPVAV